MIYIDAKTADEIALALRGRGDEYDRAIIAKKVADRLLGIKNDTSGIIVNAPRQSGKTTELLRYAEEKFPGGQFAFLTLNRYMQDAVCHMYRYMRGDPNVNPPLMITPDNIKLIGHSVKPLFIDEWNLFDESIIKKAILLRNFIAAVTS